MKKLSIYVLFSSLIIVFSSFAADHIVQSPDSPTAAHAASTPLASISTIKASTSSMSEVMRILEENDVNLKETALYLDFDETTAFTEGTCQDITFRLLTCPDRLRTYKAVFTAAFEKTGYNLEFFNFNVLMDKDSYSIPSLQEYQILDPDVIEVIQTLKERAAFVGFCSALAGNEGKYRFIKSLGLERDSYVFGGGSKPQAIYQHLNKQPHPRPTISTIVLIDNSDQFAIKPFLKDLPDLVRSLGLDNVKIIGIEFTRFSEMATPEAIREELTILKTIQRL